MRVVVFGATGFIGSRLVSRLLGSTSSLLTAGDQLVLSDLNPPRIPCTDPEGRNVLSEVEVEAVVGDLSDSELLANIFVRPVDVVFHLAAALTLDAELDFARGMEVNVHALMRLLEQCRTQAQPPRFIFSSSISTFGGALPSVVDDDVFQAPQTSYGIHKVIAEHLINDYSRRGFIDGRVLRFPIILTNPGAPNDSVSDRLAGLIREPLSGRGVVSPLAPQTRFAVASVDKAVAGLLKVAMLPASAFGATRALNLPALTTCGADIEAAIRRQTQVVAPGAITWQPDERVRSVVEGWPAAFTSKTALRLGIERDESIDTVVAAFLGAKK